MPNAAKPLLLFLLVIAVYIPSLQNGFIWDDDVYPQKAQQFSEQGFANGLKTIWLEPLSMPQYYPLVHTSYLLEHQLWGQDPAGYHLVNILLHALVAVLLWLVLRRLGLPWPFAIALLFALHPVQVESVAWITERKNVLSGVFYMASLLTFLSWHDKRYLTGIAPQRTYYLSLLFFLAALASKTVTATLPFVIMLLLWWQHQLDKSAILRLSPFVLAGVCMGLITIWIEQGHAGAVGQAWDFSFIERSLIAGRALWFYLQKLLLPLNLTFIYPRWEIDSSTFVQYLYPVAVLLSIVLLWSARKRIGRGPLVAVLIFCGTLFPALGFLNVFPMQFSFVADHFQYLAGAAMISLLVAAIHRVSIRIHQYAKVAVLLVVCLVYSFSVWHLQAQYKDTTALWTITADKNPQAWIAHGNLGAIYLNQQRYPEAIEALRKAIELNPRQIIPFNNLAKLYLDLAKQTPATLEQHSHYAKLALDYGHQALELGEQERIYFTTNGIKQRVAQDYVDSYRILGDIKRLQKDDIAARGHYETMLSMNRNSKDALNRLGAIHMDAGQNRAALSYFERSLAVTANQFDTLYNAGVILYRLKQPDKAEALLLRALNVGASRKFLIPHYYLGLIYKDAGNLTAAKQHFETAAVGLPEHIIGRKAMREMLDLILP